MLGRGEGAPFRGLRVPAAPLQTRHSQGTLWRKEGSCARGHRKLFPLNLPRPGPSWGPRWAGALWSRRRLQARSCLLSAASSGILLGTPSLAAGP